MGDSASRTGCVTETGQWKQCVAETVHHRDNVMHHRNYVAEIVCCVGVGLTQLSHHHRDEQGEN